MNVVLGVQNHKMPERMCIFTETLEAEYRFLKEDQQLGQILLSVCKLQFSAEHGGRSDVLKVITKRKHAIAEETVSCSKKATSYFTKETINILQPKDCLHSTH
jgi:hypothetical protein